jgi:hypothetical protein
MYFNAVTVLQPAACAAVQKQDALYARLLMSTRKQVKPHRARGQIQLYVYVLIGMYKCHGKDKVHERGCSDQ